MARHAVEGQVTGDTGRPVAGAFVMVSSGSVAAPDIAARTDEAGRFRLALPQGHYVLEAHYRDAHGQVAIDVRNGMAPVRLVVASE